MEGAPSGNVHNIILMSHWTSRKVAHAALHVTEAPVTSAEQAAAISKRENEQGHVLHLDVPFGAVL